MATAVVAALAGLGAGCTAHAPAPTSRIDASATPPAARPLVVAWELPMASLDPVEADCDPCRAYVDAVYDTLVAADPVTGEPVGRLARAWSAGDGLRAHTFELDPQATFADGTPVEAADVAWSWQRAAASSRAAAAVLLTGLVSVDAPDERTVVARFDAPNADLPRIATSPHLAVLNRDAVLGSGGAPGIDPSQASVGSGPYVLESFQVADQLRLARNEAHWGEPAAFDTVVIEHAPSATARLHLLRSGAADVAVPLDAEVAAEVEPSGDIVLAVAPSPALLYLALSPGSEGGAALTPGVRQAVASALDRQRLLDAVAGGEGAVAASVFPPGGPGGAEAPGAPDLDAARQLLAAGRSADGSPGRLGLRGAHAATTVAGVDLGEVMAELGDQLAAVGIELEVTALDRHQWAARLAGEGIPVTVGIARPDHSGPSWAVRRFGLVPGSLWGARAGGPAGPLVRDEDTELLADALATEDGVAQAGAYAALAGAIEAEAIVIPLVRPDANLAHRTDITGATPGAWGPLDLRAVALVG